MDVRVAVVQGRARADHAEAMAGRGFEHDPARPVRPRDFLRAERDQAPGLGFDVVALDVEMHARRVLDLLHLDVQPERRAVEDGVAVAAALVGVGERQPERAAPEVRVLAQRAAFGFASPKEAGELIARLKSSDETRMTLDDGRVRLDGSDIGALAPAIGIAELRAALKALAE